jgi:hypothetical protein
VIPYLILTSTLALSTGFTIGHRMKPHTPPAPGCPCRDQAALDAAFLAELRARFDEITAGFEDAA